jgi:hypothetical protein
LISSRVTIGGAAVVGIALAVPLLGWGDGSGERVAAAALPSCAPVTRRTELPPGWTVPLPRGTVVTVVESGAIRQVVGFAPLSFPDAVAYFREELADAGYRPGDGDAEMDEAEADFAGHGVRGRWRVNAIAGCGGASVVTVAAG